MTKSEKLQKINKLCNEIGAELEIEHNHGQYIIYTNVYTDDDEDIEDDELINEPEKIDEKDYTPVEKAILKLLDTIRPDDLKNGIDNNYSAIFNSNEIFKKFGEVEYTIYGKLEEWKDNEIEIIFDFKYFNTYVKVTGLYNSLSDYDFRKHIPPKSSDAYDSNNWEYNPYTIVRPEYIRKIKWEEIDSNQT